TVGSRRLGLGTDPRDPVTLDDERVTGIGARSPFARAVAGDELADAADEGGRHEARLAAVARVMIRWTSRAATFAVRSSTSSRGLSSVTSRCTRRPLSATASQTDWMTKGGTPSDAGALTPGAAEAGRTSRSIERYT